VSPRNVYINVPDKRRLSVSRTSQYVLSPP
jgi:hypothetical protein